MTGTELHGDGHGQQRRLHAERVTFSHRASAESVQAGFGRPLYTSSSTGNSLGAAGARGLAPRLVPLLAWAALVACGPPPGERAPDILPANPPVVVGSDTLPPERIRAYLADALGFTSRGGRVFCSYTLLGQERDRLYLGTLCEELLPTPDSLESGSGSGGPVALVLDTLASPARILEHQVPGDGSLYARDIRRIFPERIQRRILGDAEEHNRQVEALRAANHAAAAAYAGGGGR